MKKLIFIVISFFFISTSSFAEVNIEEVLSNFKTRIETDSRLNPIRGYMKIQFDETKLKPDSLLNRKPTESEKKAIATYINISEQYFRDLGVNEVNINQKFQGDDWVSILYRLKEGEITYLEHKKFQAGYDKKTRETLDKIKTDKVLKLVCIYDSPNELAGSEVIVKVNFTNNTILASKGLNQRDFVINDNQFQYTVADDLVTTISRTSGILTLTTPGLGVFGRGNCSEAKQKKF
jgi:hypothetical protein